MKKIILLLFLTTFSLGYSQNDSIGKLKIQYNEWPKKNQEMKNNEWYKLNEQIYTMTFSKSPIGIKKSIETTESILLDNNFDFKLPSIENSFLSNLVKNIHDYETLDLTIKNEMSEVVKYWVNSKYSIILNLNKQEYVISIIKK